jgi:hypothetical protein
LIDYVFAGVESLRLRPCDVNGNCEVEIKDVLELLKYLSNMKTVLACNGMKPCNPCTAGFCSYYAYDAALITPKSKENGYPRVNDVLEMLKFLAKMKSDLGVDWGVMQ